ncbi:MAG: T9SS type A sorting domain-containing protein, partial [Ignavibacteriaceae bacterium]
PFNPSTTIQFSIPESGYVRLSVYNMIGEEVKVLVDEKKDAGFYEKTFDASNLPSGAYVYKLESPGLVQAKKMLLMK